MITEIMKEWESCYDRFLQAESLENLVEEYNRLLINRGRSVMIMEPGGGYEAKALGIDSLGRLLVEVPGGTVKEISAGEVSVRGVYGYV